MSPNPMFMQIYSDAIYTTWYRWQAIHSYLGTARIRPAIGMPPAMAPRNPDAPDYKPVPGRELLVTSNATVDTEGEDAQTVAAQAIEAACYRIELQVRQAMRESRGGRALQFQPGDTFYAARLAHPEPDAGSMRGHSPFRILAKEMPGSSLVRFDFALMICLASAVECMESACLHMVPLMATAIAEAHRASEGKVQVMMANGASLFDRPVSVLVGIGEFASDAVTRMSKTLLDKVNGTEFGP